MALIVWLPMNGNLINQGLSPIQFKYIQNNGKLVLNAKGKTGKCYERTASGYNDLIRSESKLPAINVQTMCCWAYVSSTPGDSANALLSNHDHNGNTGFGLSVKQVSETDYRISCSTGTGTSRTYHTYYGTTNIKNSWHHLCLTYDGSTMKLWVDGKVEYTLSSHTNKAVSDYFDIFNWSTTHYTNTNYRPVCKLCDVRWYDHCLSTAEVKELARGLCGHWKMDGHQFQANLITNTRTLSSMSGGTKTGGGYGGFTMMSGSVPSSGDGDFCCKNSLLTPKQNTYYTLTFYARAEVDGMKIRSYFYPSNCASGENSQGATSTLADGSIVTTLTTSWQLYRVYWKTTTTTSGVKNLLVGRLKYDDNTANVGKKAYIAGVKFEEGKNVYSMWTPAQTDEEFDRTIYDSSGFNNHGTISPTVPWTTTVTGRGIRSMGFSNSSHYIVLGRNCMLTDAITVNLWMHMDTWTSNVKPISCTEGGGWNFESNSYKICFAIYANGAYRQCISDKEWTSLSSGYHMFTGTFDGLNAKLYVDGVLEKTVATGTTTKTPIVYNTTNGIFINGEAANSATTPTTFTIDLCRISDVRIYAAPLTDAEIKDLYDSPIRISNKGELIIDGDIVEVDNVVTSFSKKGNVFADTFESAISPFQIYKDKSVKGQMFIER